MSQIEFEDKRSQKKQNRKIEIEQSDSYQIITVIKKWMDEYYLDGIIGLIPVFGDGFTKLFTLPFIYVSLFKVRSIPLTLAVIYNALLDYLLGLIPLAGMVIDFLYRSYKNNFKLIVGFVENDEEIIRKVNQKAISMAIGILIVSYLLYQLISLGIAFNRWFLETINGFFDWLF